MQIEWDGSLRLWSQRKGLAEFEHWLADKGQQEGVTVDWSTLQVRCTQGQNMLMASGGSSTHLC
jgi:hypothetical protein